MDTLNSYDTRLIVSVEERIIENYTFNQSDIKKMIIDNIGVLEQYPYIYIKFKGSYTGDLKITNTIKTTEEEPKEIEEHTEDNESLSDEDLEFINVDTDTDILEFIISNLNVSNGDELILDYENQIYTLNGDNIIEDISFENGRFKIVENKINRVEIECNVALDLEVKYDSYENSVNIKYLEGLNWDINNRYREKQPFNEVNTKDRLLTSQNIGISINKISSNYFFYEKAIKEGKLLRFEYIEDNRDDEDYYVSKMLVGVSLDRYRRGFNNPDDFIMSDITGTVLDVLDESIDLSIYMQETIKDGIRLGNFLITYNESLDAIEIDEI